MYGELRSGEAALNLGSAWGSSPVNSVTTCGAETRIAVKLILINYLMLNLFGFYHGNLGELILY